jgi:ribosome-binding factor A
MPRPRRRSGGGASRGYERTDRLSELLREIIAEELDRIDDERLEMVTVTGVDVDRELERARVFFTSLHDLDTHPEIIEGLSAQRGKVRKAIGAQARIRRVPELVFVPDETLRNAERIEEILRGINEDHDDEGHDDEA